MPQLSAEEWRNALLEGLRAVENDAHIDDYRVAYAYMSAHVAAICADDAEMQTALEAAHAAIGRREVTRNQRLLRDALNSVKRPGS